MKNWVLRQFKKKARIYIMPTKMGGYLNGLIFLMFLLSVGYSNNLLLIFTLFLFGLNLIWVIQTHFHMHALKLESIQIQDGHALENVLVQMHWKKTPDGPHKWNLELEGESGRYKLATIEDNQNLSTAQTHFLKRGILQFTHLKVKSEMPFGLYQSWIYFPIKLEAWVYPARLKDIPSMLYKPSMEEGDHSSLRAGPHDVWNLGPYQGEESRKISWKHYARSGELVIKEGEELNSTIIHFEFFQSAENKEFLLSKIATQMVQCSRSETPFSLNTPSRKFPPGLSSKHLADCLRELTQC
jgi:uncharacterized protein (DUF58 family)